MADERWLPVAGFEGYYEVSDQGRIRSLDRTVDRDGARGRYFAHGKILKPFKRKDGYLFVQVNVDGFRQNKSVHRLVAETFVPNPDNLPVVNHKNENKSDNRAVNLEWCDQKYNANYGTSRLRISKKVSKSVSAKDVTGRTVATFRSQSDA